MPLDPKQLMPYYKPGTTNPNLGGIFKRLNAQYAPVITSGTTETDLYLYTIPANTLQNNGDGLIIEFITQNTAGSSDSHTHRFYLDAINQITFDNTADISITRMNIQIIKISTTQVKIISTSQIEVGAPVIQIQTANTLDFTDTIPIKFTGQCNDTAVIQTYALTIDYISA